MSITDHEEEDFLAHYGVKGMKWGVRKDPKPNVSRATMREAKRDVGKSVSPNKVFGKNADARFKQHRSAMQWRMKKDADYKKAVEWLASSDSNMKAQLFSTRKRDPDAVDEIRSRYIAIGGAFVGAIIGRAVTNYYA